MQMILFTNSDKGIQYCSNEYTDLLNANGILVSMSAKGSPYDNAAHVNLKLHHLN